MANYIVGTNGLMKESGWLSEIGDFFWVYSDLKGSG